MLVMITSRTFHEVSICALKVGWKINCYSSEWLVTDMLEEGKKKKKKTHHHSIASLSLELLSLSLETNQTTLFRYFHCHLHLPNITPLV
jgi:hypothetical protein